MNNVKIEDNKVIIVLNPLLYPIEKIKKAALDFEKVGKINVKQDSSIKVTIAPKVAVGINEIGFQFCDYILSLIQTRL